MRNFVAISWQEQFTFDEMMSTLYWANILSWIFIVLAHWNKSMGRYIPPLRQIPNQPVLLLNADASRSKKYQYNSLWFDPTGAWTHKSNPLKASMLNITPLMQFHNFEGVVMVVGFTSTCTYTISAFHH